MVWEINKMTIEETTGQETRETPRRIRTLLNPSSALPATVVGLTASAMAYQVGSDAYNGVLRYTGAAVLVVTLAYVGTTVAYNVHKILNRRSRQNND